ncbi:MAG: hypothetical protein V1847_02980 [Candidatus Diapherotrites archaeon]
MRKGVVAVALTLILILGVITLVEAINSKHSLDLQSESRLEALRSTNNKFASIENAAVNLQKTGIGRQIDSRNQLFGYIVDGNKISLFQSLPLKTQTKSNYVDFLNGVKVFVSDSSYANVFDGIRGTVQTLQNKNWNPSGTDDINAHYLALPYCAQYTVRLDANKLSWGNAFPFPDCTQSFTLSDLNRVQIDIGINDSYGANDFNQFAGPSDAFNPSSPYAYVVVHVDASKCAKCAQNLSDKNAHVTGGALNWRLYCSGASCKSLPLDVNFLGGSNQILLSHSGVRADVNITLWFDDSVEGFFLQDFNLSLEHLDQNIRQWTR